MTPSRECPVLLIHGALCDALIWRPQVSSLQRSGWTVCAPSLKGFNAPRPPISAISSDVHVEQLVDLLRRLGRPAHLVGHSRGARLALHLAADHPELARSLILAEPGGARDDDFLPGQPAVVVKPPITSVSRLTKQVREAVAREYIDTGHGDGAWARLPERFRASALRNVETLGFTVGDQTRPLSRETARKVECPTLIVTGDRSPEPFPSIGAVLAEVIPLARSMTLRGGDHFSPCQSPAGFNEAMLAFLNSIETPKSRAHT